MVEMSRRIRGRRRIRCRYLAVIQSGDGVPRTFSVIADSFGSKLLDGNEYPDAITNLFYTHLLQHALVAFDKVASGDIVLYIVMLDGGGQKGTPSRSIAIHAVLDKLTFE